MNIEHLWVDCLCYNFNHSVRISIDKEDKEAWIEVRLNRYQPLYKRIWIGLMYVLGYDCEDQEYDVTIIDKSQIEKIVSLLRKAVEESNDE